MSSQYYFAPYNANLTWKQFDVVYGIESSPSPYFYATQDVPANNSPSGVFVWSATQYERSDDVTTVYLTRTGSVPPFAPGSIVKLTAFTNSTVNYTGMVLRGGSGQFSFINPGWPQGITATAGTITCLNPAWTTGFFFQPTYTTKVATQNNAITTQLGDGYQQRMPTQVNTFSQTMNLVYQSRGKREARAINNYCQDKAGSTCFEILLPDAFLNNQPNQKWVCANAEVTPTSFGLYDLMVPVSRVFDPN